MLSDGISPDLLELLDSGSPGDLDFYCQYARHRGGPVLVLLCGAGRIATAIARQGVPVLAVDSEAAILDQARRKAQQSGVGRVMFAQADLTRFVSDARHPLVIIPGGALQRLLSLEDQRQALMAARNALAIGGRLVLDLPILHPGLVTGDAPVVRRLPAPDNRVGVVQRHRRYDPARQLVQEIVSCDWLDEANQVKTREYASMTERYSTPAEIELLLGVAGFKPALYGGFDLTPLLPGASRLVIEADRRS